MLTLPEGSKYFCGYEISEYGIKNKRVDYYALSKSFNRVLNNNIFGATSDIGYWELVNGNEEGEDYQYYEVYQYYIIDQLGYKILRYWTDELVWYNDELDMYVWGVCHFGTAWDYVLTSICIGDEEDEDDEEDIDIDIEMKGNSQ